jgi:riboflavin kinase / FMN adenylyltransferase
MTKLIRGLYNLKPQPQGSVLTIGNFDGVHIGHQALLKKVKEKALQLGVASVVITFEPLPKEFFGFKKIVPRLTRFREKFTAISESQVDTVLVIHFDQAFAEMSAEDFIQKILCDGLSVKHIIIGDDFRFGRDRLGDFTFLKNAGEKLGFTVEAMPTITIESERVSSTFVREALTKADHPLAEKLLGHPYKMQGRVVHGDQRGRIIGFPTANIYLHRAVTPVAGVFAVRMHGIDNHSLQGVANVGIRPTVGGTRSLLEVHLFDFNREIYGKQVSVEFCKKLRDEKKFENLDLLKAQIWKDAEQARKYFESSQEAVIARQ